MEPPKQALIVDDDDESVAAIRIFLRRLRWSPPHCVATGEEALQVLSDSNLRFDVVILDHGLAGELSGIQFLEQARGHVSDLPPIIMVTGEYDYRIKLEARSLGVLGFLLKEKLHEIKKLLSRL